ncbi:plastocyanin/azurin family copper-binding protein [Rufibacter soli]
MRTVKEWRRWCFNGLCLAFLLVEPASLRGSVSPATHTVEIKQMKFVPAELTVRKGDKVVFLNKDIVMHNVTETSGKTWQSPKLAPGGSWTWLATKTTGYYCSFHPVMKGKIIVK